MPSLLEQPQIKEILAALRKHVRLIGGCAGGGALLAILYILFSSPQWQATQTLVVREEASASTLRQGRFDNADAMKTAQETILELSKNAAVAEAALREAGPPASYFYPANWPAASDIKDFRDAISVSAPKGASFGATEVLYVSFADRDPKRAIALVEAACNQLDSALRNVRIKKGQSLAAELEQTLALAQKELSNATSELEKIERSVGPDLPELRVLNESGSGEGNLRQQINQIESEIRAARQAQDDIKKAREHLKQIDADPNQINAVSTLTLDRLPAIRRLKDGLIEAQLRTSDLLGKLTPGHPKVAAAKKAEEAVLDELVSEVKLALRSSESDLEAYEARVASLQKQSQDVQNRIERLAKLRAEYGNLTAAVKRRAEVVQKAEKDLSEARAMVESAQTSSLFTKVDQPTTGDRPMGPGKTTILGGGLFAGLFLGLGIVILISPFGQGAVKRRIGDLMAAPFGRRSTDTVRTEQRGIAGTIFGRRATDQVGRRASDVQQGPPRRRATDNQRRATDPLPNAPVTTEV